MSRSVLVVLTDGGDEDDAWRCVNPIGMMSELQNAARSTVLARPDGADLAGLPSDGASSQITHSTMTIGTTNG